MRYYLDTEFNGLGGELLSMALVREDGTSLYLAVPEPTQPLDPWVAENVWPLIDKSPEPPHRLPVSGWATLLSVFFGAARGAPEIVTDWPDDIRYFCETVITGPGTMAAIPGLKFDMRRVDAYPSKLTQAVQHNALWDAMALRQLVLDCGD